MRLAASAYMAGEPELLERTHGAAEAEDPEVDTSALDAFTPLPTAHGTASRTVAAQLLEQAASLNGLAEQYGLGGTPIQ